MRQKQKLQIPPNLCADFLVASSVETSWVFTLFPQKQKIHCVETKK